MRLESYIPIDQLCTHYQVEVSFFKNLNEFGLIEIRTVEESLFIHQDSIDDVEKMIRMHQELNINYEGIDTVLNLLDKIKSLQSELLETKNRLRLYEDGV
ncbi:MAG: chaperone modulator CbpM [Vicingaceae bacterium]